MRNVAMILVWACAAIEGAALVSSSAFVSPQVPGFGAVVHLPQAAHQPRKGTKLIFDIVTDGKPDELNKGLERVARYLNLNALAGNRVSDVKLALVVHGAATKAALSDTAYHERTKTPQNPNLKLARALREQGVELYVCGQSLAHNKYLEAEVAEEFQVAVSSMTVNANKQQDGFSYISFH